MITANTSSPFAESALRLLQFDPHRRASAPALPSFGPSLKLRSRQQLVNRPEERVPRLPAATQLHAGSKGHRNVAAVSQEQTPDAAVAAENVSGAITPSLTFVFPSSLFAAQVAGLQSETEMAEL